MTTSARQQRNQTCSCGSGKKFKNCCAARVDATQPARRSNGMYAGLAVLGLALAAGAAWKLGGSDPEPVAPAPPGKFAPLVTSSNGAPVNLQPMGPGGASAPGVLTPEPPGGTPPGKVWSAEHGHYHDVQSMNTTVSSSAPAGSPLGAPMAAPPAQVPGALIPEPAGGTPPGKVWSPEHGHYHDVESVKATVAPQPGPAPTPVDAPAGAPGAQPAVPPVAPPVTPPAGTPGTTPGG